MWQQTGPWNQQQWSMQQNAIANTPHEQVDWAALAKQWMQFRDAGEASGPPPPPPLPPPQNNLPSVPQSQIAPSNWSGASWNNPSSTNADSRPWNNLMADDWTSTLESEKHGPPVSNPAMNDFNPAAAALGQSHSTGNPPPLHSSQYGQLFDYERMPFEPSKPPPPQQQQRSNPYWMGQGFSNNSQPPLNDHQTPPPPAMFSGQRPPFQDFDITGPTPAMDNAKKKTLPAWIREGLEKMEREKAKKEEMEKQAKDYEEQKKREKEERQRAEAEAARTGIPLKSKFEDEDAASEDGGTNNTVDVEDAEKASADNARSTSAERISRSPSPAEKYMTAEERQAALTMKVKMMVTEILLGVTNEEIVKVCTSVYRKLRRKHDAAPAKMLAKSSALTSLKSSFGGYDSEISEDEASGYEDGGSTGSVVDSSSDDERVERRRNNFTRRQRERLRQVEEEERAAIELFNNPSSHQTEPNDQTPSVVMERKSEGNATKTSHLDENDNGKSRMYSRESSRRESRDSRKKDRNKSRSTSRGRRSTSRERRSESRERRSRSQHRDRRSRSKGRRSKSKDRRSRSQDRHRRTSRDRRSSSRKRRHRSQSRERKRRRSRSKSYERKSKQSKSKRKSSRSHSRSASRDRKRRSRSRDRKRHRSRSHNRSNRSRSKERKRDHDKSARQKDKRSHRDSSHGKSSKKHRSRIGRSRESRSKSKSREGSSADSETPKNSSLSPKQRRNKVQPSPRRKLSSSSDHSSRSNS